MFGFFLLRALRNSVVFKGEINIMIFDDFIEARLVSFHAPHLRFVT